MGVDSEERVQVPSKAFLSKGAFTGDQGPDRQGIGLII